MLPAVDDVVFQSKVLAFGEGLIASGTSETVEVVDVFACSHHQFTGGYGQVAARAPLYGEHSATRNGKVLGFTYVII